MHKCCGCYFFAAFTFAHRLRCASPMALRAAADILRRFGLTWFGDAVWASGADASNAVGAAG